MTTFGELKCEVCGISGSVVAMHRANPKGEKGRWRCEPCMTTPIDPEVLTVTDQFEAHNLDPDDLKPMTPEMVAWVRAQRGRK